MPEVINRTKVDRRRAIVSITSVYGMEMRPEMYDREQWISLLNVVDQNPGSFYVRYEAEAKPTASDMRERFYTVEDLNAKGLPELVEIAEAKGIQEIPTSKTKLVKAIIAAQ